MDKNCNEHESVIYEAFHVKITNIAEAQFPHLLHKIYIHIVYNMFQKHQGKSEIIEYF